MNFTILFMAVLLGSSGLSYDVSVVEEVDIPDVTVIDPEPEPEPENIPETKYPDDWTCFEFAMNWSEQHPEWGMVVISDNNRFQGMNHLVNYQINDDKTLQIISYVKQTDGSYEVTEYVVSEWEYDTCTFDYYHFYINGEIPTRYYNRANQYQIKPNAEAVYNNLQ